MKINLIAAMDQQRGIGKNNRLLFRISEDLKRFKELTTGHPVIMGRKTYESIGRVLPNRTNIIVTRDPSFKVAGAIIAHSLEEAIAFANRHSGKAQPHPESKEDAGQASMTEDKHEVFIIGGGQIYAQAIDMADKLYLTIVEGDFGADTFFPDYSAFTKVIKKEERESEGYKYTFLELEKEG